jgi:hypothetical protein
MHKHFWLGKFIIIMFSSIEHILVSTFCGFIIFQITKLQKLIKSETKTHMEGVPSEKKWKFTIS